MVQKGDAPKEGITSVQAVGATRSCSTTTSTRSSRARASVGLLARGGNIPLGYYNDPVKTAETFVTDARRAALVDPRRLRARRGRRSHHAARARLGVDQLRRREDLSRRGRGRAEVASRRVRRAGRRRARRTLGRTRVRVAAAATGTRRPTSRSSREHCRTRIAGYKIPRQLLLVDEVPRLPNGKPDYRSGQGTGATRARRED